MRIDRIEPAALDRLLSWKDVRAATGMGRTYVHEQMKRGAFPRARKVGSQHVRWLQSEIQAWIMTRPVAE